MPKMSAHLSNVSAYAEALYVLTEGASTVTEIARESGLALNTTRKFISSLKRRGLVRIAAWEQDTQGRHTRAAYEWGSSRDAARPPRLTLKERKDRYYAKLQQIAILRGVSIKKVRVRSHEKASEKVSNLRNMGLGQGDQGTAGLHHL